MNTLFKHAMAKVSALTRAGKLHEATALIRAALQGPTAVAPETGRVPGGTDDVIDGTFTRREPETAAKDAKALHKKSARPKSATTPLSETLRKIAAGGMPGRGPLSADTARVPPGAQFLSLDYSGAQGRRSFRLYVPANRPSTPLPLIVMLHGCTQTPEDFALGTGMNALAEEVGCLIAYPAQPSGANAQKCWNWYRPEDQARDRGEPALIAGLTRQILRDHPADPARVYIAGLSAGGAAAVVVAAAYPDLFHAVGVHSGLPAGGAQDIPSAFAAMRSGAAGQPHKGIVPTIVFHGLADTTVHPQNGAAILAQALPAMTGLRKTERTGTSDSGRPFRAAVHLHPDGHSMAEHWQIEGAGHAWAGGNPAGSYTDARGPDASREMVRFFLQHRTGSRPA